VEGASVPETRSGTGEIPTRPMGGDRASVSNFLFWWIERTL
jgi:hypothetical protein